MKDFNQKELLRKHMLKDFQVKMHVVVAMISMYMHMEEQVLTFVEKNQHSLNLLKENQEDQD